MFQTSSIATSLDATSSQTTYVPILTSDTTAETYFFRIYDAHEVAKNRGLNEYLTGKITLEKISGIQIPDKFSYYREALAKQTRADELVEYTALMTRIKSDKLYPYQLLRVNDPAAVNPLIPLTHDKATGRAWRTVANLIPSTAVRSYFNSIGVNIPVNRAQASVIINANLSTRYSTEWSFHNDADYAVLCNAIPNLDPDDIEDLVQQEIKFMAEIARLEPDDTVESIVLKLRSTSCVQEFDKAHSDVQTRIDKVLIKQGQIKEFIEKVIPVSRTICPNSIESKNWKEVMTKIEAHYIATVKFTDTHTSDPLYFGIDTTVLMFKSNIQRHLARIQVIEQEKDKESHGQRKLTFAEALEEVLEHDDNSWTTKFTDPTTHACYPRKMTRDHVIVEKIISAIQPVEEYRLAIDARLTANPDSTPTEILDIMRAKENLIKQFKKVRVNAVHLPHGNSNSNHCNYHSYNNNKSTHSTADCHFVKNGLVEEVSGSQFLRLKSTQEFYKPPTAAQAAQYKLDRAKRRELSKGGQGGKGKEKVHGGKRNNSDRADTSNKGQPSDKVAAINPVCDKCLTLYKVGKLPLERISDHLTKDHSGKKTQANHINTKLQGLEGNMNLLADAMLKIQQNLEALAPGP
jgi:hypothetical protein